MKEALGLIEVKGLVATIEVADVMAKVAAIKIEKAERARGFGWTTLCILGDVAAVQAAIQAGVAIAKDNNWLVSSKVIPRPANDLAAFFTTKTTEEKVEVKEIEVKEEVSKAPKEEKVPKEKPVEVTKEQKQPVKKSKAKKTKK